MDALVVGAGVSGLSCAVRLGEAGLRVEIWSEQRGARTTSAVAAAIWYAYKAGPREKVDAWALESYAEFRHLARDAASGVTMRAGVELLPDDGVSPAWRGGLDGFRALARGEGTRGTAFEYVVPVVEMPLYLAYLERRALRAGARVIERKLHALDEALAVCPLVVNCTGLGARALTDDTDLHPIRGQVVRVDKCGIERFLLDDYNPRGLTYVVPRSHDCVLGGTAEAGLEGLEPDDAVTRAILARCTEHEPRLARAHVLAVAVGLRPGRSSVRLECETRERGIVVHDYGHGGAGVTLSWGCANEVLRLARSAGGVRHAAR
ncbi:MAG: FAD-dependent oxidoreductase [Planctomycetota bacterium]